MKFSIMGFNQQSILELPGDRLDLTDLVLLDYIWQAQAHPSMQHILEDGIPYVWISYDKLCSDLPILNLQKRTIQLHISKLKEHGLIRSHQVSNESMRGSKTYFAITDKCSQLVYAEGADVINHTSSCESDVINYTSSSDIQQKSEEKEQKTPRADVINYTSDNINNINIKENINIKIRKDIEQAQSSKKSAISKLVTDKDWQHKEQNALRIANMYNSICTNLSKVRVLDSLKIQRIDELLKTYSEDDFKEAFTIANDTPFLLGENDRGWKANFKFLIKEDKLTAVLEGNYGTRGITTNNRHIKESDRNVKCTKQSRQEKEQFLNKLKEEGQKIEY